MANFFLLPPEILYKIFTFLDFPSLKASLLVCSYWRGIGEDPNLWKYLKMVETHPEDIKMILSLPRLTKLQYLKISDWLSEEQVRMLKSLKLKTLDMSRCYLHEIAFDNKSIDPEAELLSELLVKIEVVNANRAVLSDEQWLRIFQGLGECEKLKMKTLIINTTEEVDEEDLIADLSHISPDVFARAIGNLVTVQVADACLTTDQISALVKSINNGSKVKNLSLANNDISEVDSEELARAMNKLEMLDLSGTNFGDLEDPNIFFRQMTKSTNLKLLDIGFNTLRKNNNRILNPKVMARALNKIEDLRMVGVDISAVQAHDLFKRMCVQTSIKTLQFEDCNIIDLSLVNPNFMASGLNKLSKLKMANSSMNGSQCLEFFTRAANFSRLQHLDFSFLDLCLVPGILFSDALNKVREVIISDCCVTEEQTTLLFEMMSISTNIQMLDISLVSLEHIPAKIFVGAARRLLTLKAVDSDLQKEQLELVLLQITIDDKLKVLEISRDEAKVVSDEVIQRSKLNELRVSEDFEYESDNYLQFYSV